MKVGVPKEIKTQEFRVGLTPSSVRELTTLGHTVLVETTAGEGIGFSDEQYIQAGAQIAKNANEVFAKAKLIIKVKEPQIEECKLLNESHILFTYLHLAPDPKQTKALLESGCTAIAYETITDKNDKLPLLLPMSAVAGRMSIQVGAQCLEKHNGGRGVLLGGVAGVSSANVLIIGGGVVGANAAKMAVGAGAQVTVLDKSVECLEKLDRQFGGTLDTQFASITNLENCLQNADLLIGAILTPGDTAQKIIQTQHLKIMKPRSVVVDVSIDQGGCIATSRPTTHDKPTFIVEDVVHYCVANMPGAVPRTSTIALNNSTLPYIIQLASGGIKAVKDNPGFLAGVNIDHGKVTYNAVAKALGYEYCPALDALAERNIL